MGKVFSGTGTKISQYGSIDAAAGVERVGAIFKFTETSFTSRVGISFISPARACQHVDTEIPAGTSLLSLANVAKNNWNTQVLSKIETSEVKIFLRYILAQILMFAVDRREYASAALLFTLRHAHHSV